MPHYLPDFDEKNNYESSKVNIPPYSTTLNMILLSNDIIYLLLFFRSVFFPLYLSVLQSSSSFPFKHFRTRSINFSQEFWFRFWFHFHFIFIRIVRLSIFYRQKWYQLFLNCTHVSSCECVFFFRSLSNTTDNNLRWTCATLQDHLFDPEHVASYQPSLNYYWV